MNTNDVKSLLFGYKTAYMNTVRTFNRLLDGGLKRGNGDFDRRLATEFYDGMLANVEVFQNHLYPMNPEMFAPFIMLTRDLRDRIRTAFEWFEEAPSELAQFKITQESELGIKIFDWLLTDYGDRQSKL